jgi:ssDNA-binding replication factor A large subunit
MTSIAENKFDRLLSNLASKSGLGQDKLAELIQRKKETVGGGYLTNQGALFLVASELGITLNYDDETFSSLSEVSKDQPLVSVCCRILSVGVPRVFTRKSDAKKGFLSRVVIYDDNTTLSASFWDRAAFLFVEAENFFPGDLIRISNAYVRAGLDGTISLNVGERTKVEKISDETASIKKLEQKISLPSSIPENSNNLIVRGRVVGEVRKSPFTKSDGSSSELTSFAMTGLEKENPVFRVVIWGNPNPVYSTLKDSEVVTLLNVRTKLSNFQNSVSVEIHGDDTTCVLERWGETRDWMKSLGPDDNQSSAGPEANKTFAFVARILSKGTTTSDKTHLLLTDSQKRKISLTASGDSAKEAAGLAIDELVVCRPETMDSETLRANTSDGKSFTKSTAKRQDIPTSNSLVSTVENLSENGIASLELMCLTDPINREIQSKEGGLVRRTEITVADHTGEIKIYGWRNLAKELENYSAGDRIFLSAVEVQTHEGKKFLVLKNYSAVTKKA